MLFRSSAKDANGCVGQTSITITQPSALNVNAIPTMISCFGANNGSITASATGGTPTSYTATSSPGGFTGTGASSPVTVSGLTNGTAYTFTVTATNSNGTSPSSSASSSFTPVAPTNFYSIQTVTVDASGTTSITFSSIPQTYTHLQVRMVTAVATSDANKIVTWN